MTNVLRKTVNIIPQVPFPLKQIIARPIYNVNMSIGDIRVCILKRAIVQEVLPNGKLLNLNLENYDKVNYKESPKIIIEEPKEDIVSEVIKDDVIIEDTVDIKPTDTTDSLDNTSINSQYQRKNNKKRK